MAVLGVDACRGGWVALRDDLAGFFGSTIGEVVAAAEQDAAVVTVVGIDIPIGLPTATERRADLLARRMVGRRASSVFSTPVRAALQAPTHAEASAVAASLTGRGISRQAYALGPRILDVDTWARSADLPVIEVHPEVSFATMAGHPLAHGKKSWAGAEERRRLLVTSGVGLPGDLGPPGAVAAADDVLDALAVCWTARRYAEGRARCYPDEPEDFGDGHAAAIWA